MRVAISRDAVEEMINDIRDCISVDGYWAILERLKKIPPVDWSVQEFADRCRECGAKYGKLLEQKSGKWIAVYQGDEIINYRCSECELGDTNGSTNLYGWDYCRRCGARMYEPQESEDKE